MARSTADYGPAEVRDTLIGDHPERGERSSHPASPSGGDATLGMRGGLGKTLLIAFLLLAIVPLSALAFVTYNQVERNTRQKVLAELAMVASLEEAHLVDWVEGYEGQLALLAAALDGGDQRPEGQPQFRSWLSETQTTALMVMGEEPAADQVLAGDGSLMAGDRQGRRLAIVPPSEPGGEPLLAISYPLGEAEGGVTPPLPRRWLVALLPREALSGARGEVEPGGKSQQSGQSGMTTYLATGDGLITLRGAGSDPAAGQRQPSTALGGQPAELALALSGRNRSGEYSSAALGTISQSTSSAASGQAPVFGAYRWNEDLQAAVLAELPQTEALTAGSTLTAALVAVTLAMALVTAAIAAVVTRQVTRPIVQLTETAARMARGDLDQQVTVTRRDEIGVLARAFNRMAAELRVLYGNLETKVAQRTQQLEEAKEEARHHAMQLDISAEVARVATSIRDVDGLLTTAVGLIARSFELEHVAIYLAPGDQQGEEGWGRSRSIPTGRSGWAAGDGSHGDGHEGRHKGLPLQEPAIVGQAIATGQRQVAKHPDCEASRPQGVDRREWTAGSGPQGVDARHTGRRGGGLPNGDPASGARAGVGGHGPVQRLLGCL